MKEKRMIKRHIDSLGADISLLGFGCMRLPVVGQDPARIDYPAAQSMVDRAIKEGVNYFDTAWPYHERMSEVFVGDTLAKYPRDRYFLASKMPSWEAFTSPAKNMETRFSEQLKKCKTGYFDFYLAHSLDRDNYKRFKQYGMYEFLKKKKAEGKIRRLGFSFHDSPELLKEIIDCYDWEFVQIQLNYLDWNILRAKECYELLTERHLPVIVMEPVRGGALATLNDKAAGILQKADPGASTASWAMRFAASLPNVMTVLSGMSTMDQLEDNVKTISNLKPLDEAESKALAEAAAMYQASGAIPCTGCRYCSDCPAGVDIPRIFSIYNFYQVYKNRIAFNNSYHALSANAQAHNCTVCGQCMTHCPQGIKVPDRLSEIASFAAVG
jgi:predicted aldo/keto reductase-like oxidoreductase